MPTPIGISEAGNYVPDWFDLMTEEQIDRLFKKLRKALSKQLVIETVFKESYKTSLPVLAVKSLLRNHVVNSYYNSKPALGDTNLDSGFNGIVEWHEGWPNKIEPAYFLQHVSSDLLGLFKSFYHRDTQLESEENTWRVQGRINDEDLKLYFDILQDCVAGLSIKELHETSGTEYLVTFSIPFVV